METPADKRARLRRDLQKAYGEWMVASESAGVLVSGLDAVGLNAAGLDAAKAKWSAFLDAKARLVAAYAERATAA